MVLRVSKRMLSVSLIASTYLRVRVAMPERCCNRLMAVRSALRRSTVPVPWRVQCRAGTLSLSVAKAFHSIALENFSKMSSASGSPAQTMSSRAAITPSNMVPAGITASEVRSPCPTSSCDCRVQQCVNNRLVKLAGYHGIRLRHDFGGRCRGHIQHFLERCQRFDAQVLW